MNAAVAPADGVAWPGVSALIERLYRARGVASPADCSLGLDGLLAPQGLLGIDRACAALAEALRAGQRIVIVGDCDLDGASATALALRALRAMGAVADYVVPDRLLQGHGLSSELLVDALALRPALLLTVDNGITANAAIAEALAQGVPVIITDHHLPVGALPDALAIVNPNQPGCAFPSKSLCGTGVAFYLLWALRERLVELGWFAEQGIAEPLIEDWLDLVALGTIADLVPLDRNNRILVQQGLERIRAGRAAPCFSALLRLAGRNPAALVAADISFQVAPRFNAAGRLAHMSAAVECLIEDDPARAAERAGALDALNQRRRTLSERMRGEANAALARMARPEERSIVLHDPGWHAGMIGLLAGQLCGATGRPVAVLTDEPGDAAGELLRGSMRSVPGMDLMRALREIAAAEPSWLVSYGGHAMAAGLRLARPNLQRFAAALEAATARQLDAAPPPPRWSDGSLAAEDGAFTVDTALALRDAGPWGQGFPEPLFDDVFWVRDYRWMGRGEDHLRLRLSLVPHGGAELSAVFFRAGSQWPKRGAARARLRYRLGVNDYRGRREVQLVVQSLEALQ